MGVFTELRSTTTSLGARDRTFDQHQLALGVGGDDLKFKAVTCWPPCAAMRVP